MSFGAKQQTHQTKFLALLMTLERLAAVLWVSTMINKDPFIQTKDRRT
jgi:hypothetical protein